MSMNIEKIGEAELMAYVDGQLDDRDRELIERYLAENPDKAALVEEWQMQSTAINALFNPVASEPVPDKLNPHKIAAAPKPANDNFWRMAAAALVLLVLGSTLGWVGRDMTLTQMSAPQQSLITAATEAHALFVQQANHPVEVDGSRRTYLANWLSNGLDRQFEVPNLNARGFELVGGRLLPGSDGTAAQLMYESERGRITLYLTPKTDAQPNQNQFASVENLSAYYWANDAVTCTIVGNFAEAEIKAIASDVFEALSGNTEYRFG